MLLETIAAEETAAKQRLDMQAKQFDEEKAFNEYKAKELLRIELEATRKRVEALRKLQEEERQESTELLIRQFEAQEALLDLRLRTMERATDALSEKLKERLKQGSNRTNVGLKQRQGVRWKPLPRAQIGPMWD